MNKINTDSNLYTLIYAMIIGALAAVLLAFVNQTLKSRQEANALLDKQKQILVALNVDFSKDDPAKIYKSVINDTLAFQSQASNKVNYLFIANIDGLTKYVIPLYGQGLWGAIWGYIALNDDRNTVFGINFGHESETPGLGGEIVTPTFRKRFIGKHIQDASGMLRSIAVVKNGKKGGENQECVDAWAGATITSMGVNDMLYNTLMEYKDFLEKPVNKGSMVSEEVVNHSAKEDD